MWCLIRHSGFDVPDRRNKGLIPVKDSKLSPPFIPVTAKPHQHLQKHESLWKYDLAAKEDFTWIITHTQIPTHAGTQGHAFTRHGASLIRHRRCLFQHIKNTDGLLVQKTGNVRNEARRSVRFDIGQWTGMTKQHRLKKKKKCLRLCSHDLLLPIKAPF